MSIPLLDEFFRACEVAGGPNLSITNPRAFQTLSRPFAVLGRDPRCDLVLNDPRISLRHCYLQAIGPKLLCVDLGSESGIDGGRGPVRACWIDRRHAVGIGGRIIRLAGASESAAAQDESTSQWASSEAGSFDDERLLSRPMPRVVLEFEANNVKTRWRMKRAVALVGSATGCAVRLNGSSVSPYHCALVLTGLGLWVVDLLGAVGSPLQDGISVNGRGVRFARLDPGDVLRIGQFRVNVRHVEWARKLNRHANGRVVVAMPDHSEIEASHPSAVAWDVETLQNHYESHLRDLANRHNAEIESLRDEIDTLRDLLEEHRSGSSSTSSRQAHDIPPMLFPRSSEPSARETVGFRILGTATRLSTTTCDAVRVEPNSRKVDVLGLAAIARPDLAAIDGEPREPWLTVDSSLLTTTHDTRPLP